MEKSESRLASTQALSADDGGGGHLRSQLRWDPAGLVPVARDGGQVRVHVRAGLGRAGAVELVT